MLHNHPMSKGKYPKAEQVEQLLVLIDCAETHVIKKKQVPDALMAWENMMIDANEEKSGMCSVM